MKKAITFVLTLLLLIFLTFLFESCKKDPIEEAKSDLYKKLKGTWVLSDYTSTQNGGWSVSGDYDWTSDYFTFSNYVVTCMSIHSELTWPNNPICDTTIDTFRCIKHLDFNKYKKDILYYTESTTESSTTTIKDRTVDWTNLSIDNLTITLGPKTCKMIIDESDNLVITYSYIYYHISGGESEDTKWIFKKE